MEVKIGIQHAPRELTVDCQEDQQTVESKVTAALPDGVLSLTDTAGPQDHRARRPDRLRRDRWRRHRHRRLPLLSKRD